MKVECKLDIYRMNNEETHGLNLSQLVIRTGFLSRRVEIETPDGNKHEVLTSELIQAAQKAGMP